MRTLFCICFALSAMAIALPRIAAAQGVAAFDGTYAGISLVLAGDNSRHKNCPPGQGVGVLTIRGGIAQAGWAGGTYDGQVSAQGVLTMRATNGAHFDGQISGGTIKGHSLNGNCAYDITWQKR